MDDKPLWGLRVLKFDGVIAPRVLKFDSGYAAEGCGGAPLNYRRRPLMIKPLQLPWRALEMHPFWWLAPPPSPRRGDFILRYALSEGIALRSFILPLLAGEVRRSRIGGSERSEPVSRMRIKAI